MKNRYPLIFTGLGFALCVCVCVCVCDLRAETSQIAPPDICLKQCPSKCGTIGDCYCGTCNTNIFEVCSDQNSCVTVVLTEDLDKYIINIKQDTPPGYTYEIYGALGREIADGVSLNIGVRKCEMTETGPSCPTPFVECKLTPNIPIKNMFKCEWHMDNLLEYNTPLQIGYTDFIISKNFTDLSDWDHDLIPNKLDNCPYLWNQSQEDTDADKVGDVCDNCPNLSNYDQRPICDNPIIRPTELPEALRADIDSDGVPTVVDNCPTVPNAYQDNADGDSFGDICDNCRDNANSDQKDSDNDGIGDACDTQTEVEEDTTQDTKDATSKTDQTKQGDTPTDQKGSAASTGGCMLIR